MTTPPLYPGAIEKVAEMKSCWNCRAFIRVIVRIRRHDVFGGTTWRYHCKRCDCEGGINGLYVRPEFTDPEYMREHGLIDHGLVHVPSPA